MDIYSYLQQNYKKVEQLKGGGYFCTDREGNNLYVPANYNGNMGMVAYLPGDGGSYNDARVWRDIIQGNNPPPYIVSISHTAYHSTAENLLTDTYNGLTGQGLNITDVVQMSFSASGYSCYDSMNRFLTEHPDVNTTMVINNTTNDSSKISHPGNYQAIIDADVPIIYVDPSGKQAYRYQKMIEGTENGFNMYWLQSNSGSHMGYNNDIIYNRFCDYLLGYTDSFGSERESGGHVEYKLVEFDPELGKYVEADYNDLVTSFLNRAGVPDIDRILAYDAFNITTNKVANDEMGTLSYLDDLHLTSSTGTVSSDYYFVNTSMNDIRHMIKTSSYLQNLSVQTFRSGDGIPGCISGYIQAYFDVVNDLLSTLALEAESVLSYAQAMVDMDNDQAAGATELGSIIETPYGADAKPASSYVPPKKTDEVYTSGTPTGGGCGSSGGGCGSSGGGCGSSGGGCASGGGQSQITEPETTGAKQIKYVFEDGHHALITYDGAEIKEFKYQYKYDDAEKAKAAYPDVFVKYHYEDYVDKLVMEEDHIDVLIKPDSYSELEFKEIEKKFLEGAKVEYE